MFGIARYIVRHKVGAVAALALAVVFATPEADPQAEQSVGASVQQPAPVQMAQASETGFINDMLQEASGLVGETESAPGVQVE